MITMLKIINIQIKVPEGRNCKGCSHQFIISGRKYCGVFHFFKGGLIELENEKKHIFCLKACKNEKMNKIVDMNWESK